MPPISIERQADVQVQLRDSSHPDFDYFVLVVLSATIATFGLLTDSVAVIIGAMLVAPLMSPILGIGLASIKGDSRLLTDGTAALLRGAALAVALAVILTWFNNLLPFVSLQEVPAEVLSRTRPTPIDLGVALAGGLAATFALAQPQLSAALPGVAIATALMPPICTVGIGIALGDWRIAGGALLLFITNAITIAASAIFLFFLMGFKPPQREGEGPVPRSLYISAGVTLLLMAPLGWQSYVFFQEANLNRQINQVVNEEVAAIGGELTDLDWRQEDDIISMNLDILVNRDLTFLEGSDLQAAIAADLQRTVQLQINPIVARKLDPQVPPTLTPTQTVGPSPTVTETPIPPTSTPSPTPTFTPSPTYTPTFTATFTPTPGLAVISGTYGGGTNLRAHPGQDQASIAFLQEGAPVTVLYGYQIVDGWVWIEVQDSAGRIGWVPQFFTELVMPPSATPSSTHSPTLTTQP